MTCIILSSEPAFLLVSTKNPVSGQFPKREVGKSRTSDSSAQTHKLGLAAVANSYKNGFSLQLQINWPFLGVDGKKRGLRG